MTIGKSIIKINVSAEGDENDVNTFMNNLIDLTFQDGWSSNSGLFTKEINYNESAENEINLFNSYIENSFINNIFVYTDVKKYYQWQ